MPPRPATFAEQRIFEMIGWHRAGDLAGAARIQQKLGAYYGERGDQQRSFAAFLKAAEAERLADEPRGAELAPLASASAPALRPSYFGYEGRTLHTWDFSPDGTFLHTWIVSGAGTSVRNSERGSYRLRGDTLELKLNSSATGFVTPGAGGRTTLSGGGAEEVPQTRQVTIRFDSSAVILDGVRLQPKSW
jgi:hypothetical protein